MGYAGGAGRLLYAPYPFRGSSLTLSGAAQTTRSGADQVDARRNTLPELRLALALAQHDGLRPHRMGQMEPVICSWKNMPVTAIIAILQCLSSLSFMSSIFSGVSQNFGMKPSGSNPCSPARRRREAGRRPSRFSLRF